MNRGRFVLCALGLLVAASILHGALAAFFGHAWSPLVYFSPRVFPVEEWNKDKSWALAVLLSLVPLGLVAVRLANRRLLELGASPLWAGLAVVPYVQVAFFFLLAVTPRKDPERFLLANLLGVGIAALAFTIVLLAPANGGTLATDRTALGLGLFFGAPFVMGFWSAYAVSWNRTDAAAGAAIGAAASSLGLAMIALMALAFEGVACLVMAAPILSFATFAGAIVGHLAGRLPRSEWTGGAALLLALALIGRDIAHPPEAVALEQTSEIRVAAAPATVFRHVTAITPMDEPAAPIFAICPMPLSSPLHGTGQGAKRECILTVGKLEETVSVWEEGRELTFDVDRAPARFARYGSVERGRFLLIANSDGTTTIRGTSWYRLRIAPAAYWSAWTQLFVHSVHERVLEHVKREIEEPACCRKRGGMPAWMAFVNQSCNCTRHSE